VLAKTVPLVLLIALATAGCASSRPQDSPDLPNHVTPIPEPGQEALVFWGQTREERIADGAAIGIEHIREVGPGVKEVEANVWIKEADYSQATSAVLGPGTYDLRATCQTGRGFEFQNAQLTVVAGKRYLARCVGQTRRSVRLEITEF
jgi:hypothetical protein